MGGIIHEYNVPSPAGETTNVLLSYPHTKDYYANPFYVNMLIGPAAGRIKQATFDVAGETIKLHQTRAITRSMAALTVSASLTGMARPTSLRMVRRSRYTINLNKAPATSHQWT
nr:hypothetical protein [Secundilactobacillus kimchicus]